MTNLKIITYNDAQLDNTVVALGKFQGLHKGHMLLIEETVSIAKQYGKNSVVFTINAGNDKYINMPEERYGILDSLGVDIDVECIFNKEFSLMQPEDFVKKVLIDKLNASYVVVGNDFRFGYNRTGDIFTLIELGEKYGFEVKAFEKLCVEDNVISSSLIRNLLEEGKVDEVEKYMGRPYFISGTVVHGKKLGRTIGFPTINVIPDSRKLTPLNGVYETRINIDGTYYKGITNIGNNPTVEDIDIIKVETNIIDFDKDIYDLNVVIEFIKFIRSEKKFNNIQELQNQIKKDKIMIMHQ